MCLCRSFAEERRCVPALCRCLLWLEYIQRRCCLQQQWQVQRKSDPIMNRKLYSQIKPMSTRGCSRRIKQNNKTKIFILFCFLYGLTEKRRHAKNKIKHLIGCDWRSWFVKSSDMIFYKSGFFQKLPIMIYKTINPVGMSKHDINPIYSNTMLTFRLHRLESRYDCQSWVSKVSAIFKMGKVHYVGVSKFDIWQILKWSYKNLMQYKAGHFAPF